MNFNVVSVLLFLVISITPCSAVLMNGMYVYDGTHSNIVDANDFLSVIDHDLDELDSVILSLNQSVTYIMEKKDNYGWNILKWPGITDDIAKTASKIHVDANKCKKLFLK